MGKAMKTTLFGGLALKQRDRAICVVVNELQLRRVFDATHVSRQVVREG